MIKQIDHAYQKIEQHMPSSLPDNIAIQLGVKVREGHGVTPVAAHVRRNHPRRQPLLARSERDVCSRDGVSFVVEEGSGSFV